MKFYHPSISSKIYAISFIAVLGSLIATGLTFNDARNGLESQKQIELKHLTELAYGIIKEEHAAATKNVISTEEAKKRAATRISTVSRPGSCRAHARILLTRPMPRPS